MQLSSMAQSSHRFKTECEFQSLAGAALNFKGEKRGWRKSLETLQNLRQPLSIIRELDND
jgi:hypothetical protein